MLKLQNTYQWRLLCALVLTAIFAGLGGIFLHELLHVAEKLLFGQAESQGATFFLSVPPLRRFWVVFGTGLLSAFGWLILQSKHRQILSIKAQMAQDEQSQSDRPILWVHFCHILLQIVSVGAGSPIGKVGAPRELGALGAGRIAACFKLTLPDRRFLIACGAAAGLAAVYQVPLASIFFIFETLAIGLSIRNLLLAGLATFLAAWMAQLVISPEALYQIAAFKTNWSSLLVALVVGAIVGPLAQLFQRIVVVANCHKQKDKLILAYLPLAFALLALLSLTFPELLGNGGAFAQQVFNGMGMKHTFLLLFLKAALVVFVMRAGAYGGTLTPSFAMGSALGLIIFSGLHLLNPNLASNAAILSGAVAFLATTMSAPLTAVGLVMSFTGQPPSGLLPLLVAVVTAHFINIFLTTLLNRN